MIVRVATVNLYNDLSRWRERRVLLARELSARGLDLIALQEVTTPLGVSTAHWLAEALGGFEALVCPKTGWGRSREGIAVLSRWPVESHGTLDLGSQQRVAQRVRVRVDGRLVTFVNGHFYWPVGVHQARVRQVERLLEWLPSAGAEAPVVVCGDFNATPGSRAIEVMSRTFRSAHQERHGREPDFTCPTPLVLHGGRLRGAVTRGLLRAFSNRPGETWQATLDYIFVSPDIQVVDCGVFLDEPAPEDPTLYASDHLGLVATLEVPDRHGSSAG